MSSKDNPAKLIHLEGWWVVNGDEVIRNRYQKTFCSNTGRYHKNRFIHFELTFSDPQTGEQFVSSSLGLSVSDLSILDSRVLAYILV